VSRIEISTPVNPLIVEKFMSAPADTCRDASFVLLSCHSFLNFNANSFCCRHCFDPLATNRFEQVQVGFATSINIFVGVRLLGNLRQKQNLP
jgi:hypothetical protein